MAKKTDETNGTHDEAQLAHESRLRQIAKVQGDLGTDLEPTGADPCPNCGYQPVGMIKTPSYMKDGLEVPAVIEVGCIGCRPVYVKSESGVDGTLDGKEAKVARRSYSARAYSLSDAIEKWNARNFVEDTRFGLNTSPSEEARRG